AEFLEDGVSSIVSPAAADVLEACRTLHVQRGVTFRSADRPQSGEIRFNYVEEDTVKAGRSGDVELPEIVTLEIAPWEGCEPARLTARLRYRLANGALLLGYRLTRPHEVLRAAWDTVVMVANKETGLYVYAGIPRVD